MAIIIRINYYMIYVIKVNLYVIAYIMGKGSITPYFR